jgi:DNA gyrase subunit B
MIWELVANAVDEHLAGHCSRIAVDIKTDGSVMVEDDGRGMPLHVVDGVPFPERAFTTPHATATLDGHAPHEHLVLHGVGLSPVCALSSWLELEVFQGGRRYWQRFERGKPVSPCEDGGFADRTGTIVAFAPDPQIFADVWINPGTILARIRELSCLLPRLTFAFRDHREHVFHEPRGLQALLDTRAPSRLSPGPSFSATGKVGEILVEVIARWGSSQRTSIESYANLARTTEGGSHVDGALRGLADGLRKAAPGRCEGLPPDALETAVKQGLVAVVRVRLDDPCFAGPTRDRLVTPEATHAVQQCVADAFQTFLKQQPSLLDYIVTNLSVTE